MTFSILATPRACAELRRALLPAFAALAAAACADAPTDPTRGAGPANAALTFPTDPGPVPSVITEEWASVSAGGDHSCAVTVAGRVYCWGSNAMGQLGSAGGDALRPRAVDVSTLSSSIRFQQVSAGERHTCALSGSLGWGYIYCWGIEIGQTPTAVPLGLTFATVSVGSFEVCALTSLGYAYCWPHGRSPASVPGGTLFASISAGVDHNCGVAKYSAKAFCWGENSEGELGINSYRSRSAPDTVRGGVWSGVDAGKNFSCGVRKSAPPWEPGGAFCWGDNGRGQLGNAITIASPQPEAVWGSTGADLDVVSAGGQHACGLQLAWNGHGDAWCWGDDTHGQLGDPNVTGLASVPGRVAGDRVYRQISAGRDHSCALSRYTRAANLEGASPSAPVIHCWGRNTSGQLGNMTTTDSGTPVTAIHPQHRYVIVLP